MAIVNIDNRYSCALAMIAGVMITATRFAIPQLYPSQATNGWAYLFAELSTGGLTPFALLAGIVSFLVQFGGVSIFMGGLLCAKSHLRSGKESVGIGTTFGFAGHTSRHNPPSDQVPSDQSIWKSSHGWVCSSQFSRAGTSRVLKGPMLVRSES